MKITVELPDDLLQHAKKYAARMGITMREVIELGLQLALNSKKPSRRPFRLRTITTKGEGLVCDGDWSTIRSFIYDAVQITESATENTEITEITEVNSQ